MENKINIAELLKDCPKGMELDCTIYDNVTLEIVFEGCLYPIQIQTPVGLMNLTKYGSLYESTHSKCVIFPKGKTTWEGFVPPYKFKDGDIIYVKSLFEWVVIYKESNGDYLEKYVSMVDRDVTFSNFNPVCLKNSIEEIRLATEEEKQRLFDAIKENGYKWNAETKTLEKLPKFKVGDRVCNKNYKDYIYDIHDIVDKGYRAKEINADSPILILFGSQEDNYELVPNKFDISTLKPFDKVLVRDENTQEWRISLFSHCNGLEIYKYSCINGSGYTQCIPYKGNEHLLGTTNDCDEYYK